MAARYTIDDEKRGHRPRLSDDEPTVIYNIKLPQSLKTWCLSKGPQFIRRILNRVKIKEEDKSGGFIMTIEQAQKLGIGKELLE